MRQKEIALANRLDAALITFDQTVRPLPGVRIASRRSAFVEQLIESVRRVRFISTIQNRPISVARMDASSPMFDPIRAAMLHFQRGDSEEASWLVFLSVHFGKNRRTGWKLCADIYRGEGSGGNWTWDRIRSNVKEFRLWLAQNTDQLRGAHFGNHRKYESLHAYSNRGTGAAIASYVEWIGRNRTHASLIQEAQGQSQDQPRVAFEILYQSMSSVISFGRTAKFDYLTMLGKIRIADIEPGSTYMDGATGPHEGARLLFEQNPRRATLDEFVVELESALDVGMQVMEDALCNWQKSPDRFKAFRG